MAPSPRPARSGSFALYVAAVLTVVCVLFPPFTSLAGTEYAFVLTGPEWSRALAAGSDAVGLGARVYWPLLLTQLAAVWALALGARRFLAPPQRRAL